MIRATMVLDEPGLCFGEELFPGKPAADPPAGPPVTTEPPPGEMPPGAGPVTEPPPGEMPGDQP
jgi:hypothetical protein